MSKQRETLQMALDALEEIHPGNMTPMAEQAWNKAINAIREALDEPEQKPVGIVRTVGGYPDDSTHTVEWLGKHKELRDGDKLYASPQTRNPEPEQKPVAWLSQGGDVSRSKKHFDEMGFVDSIPLYTSPAAFTPLTDEQVEDEWERITGHSIFGGDRSEGKSMYLSPDEVIEFARAIERAHGIDGGHE